MATTWRTVCEILRALPGTELDEGVDNPAWRVNSKVLARLNPRLRTPDEEERRAANGEVASVWVERDERELLTRDDPDTFFITPHWQTSPHVLVWLACADAEQLRELLTDAWRARAPKRLARTRPLREGMPHTERPAPEEGEAEPHEPPDGEEHEPGPPAAPRDATGERNSDVHGDDD